MRIRAGHKKPRFKDFYYVLGLDPDGPGEAIEKAYWGHVRARGNAQTARAQIDDLNEAYAVLGTPSRRREYDRLRDETLGVGASPRPPRADGPPLPLSVMAKQRPKPRGKAEQQESARGLFRLWPASALSWRTAANSALLLALAAAASLAASLVFTQLSIP